MSVLGAAFITYFAIFALTWHMSRTTCQRLAGYALLMDILIHGSVIWLFFGKSTLGLMQAELSAIFFTLTIRTYRWTHGYLVLRSGRWVLYPGAIAR